MKKKHMESFQSTILDGEKSQEVLKNQVKENKENSPLEPHKMKLNRLMKKATINK